MIKTYIQSLKCCNCNKSIGENAPIIESKAMVGTYLTVCPHCVTELITAGQNLVKIPEQMSINMRDELINGISAIAIKEANRIREAAALSEKAIKTKENLEDNNTTAYVVLVDGDAYDEYTKETSLRDIFTSMINEFGEEAVANGDVKLCELKEIKPKFKKKITYVLDM